MMRCMLNADADDGEGLDGHRRSVNMSGGVGASATPTHPTGIAQPAPATTPVNGSTTQDEGREREESRHVRFGGSGHATELGETEEWGRSLEERRSDSAMTLPRQGEVNSEKGAFCLIGSSCGLIGGTGSSTGRNNNDYYSSPNYDIPPNIDYKYRCAYFSHSRPHWQIHHSALSQPTRKGKGRGRGGRQEGFECSCCKRNKPGDGLFGV